MLSDNQCPICYENFSEFKITSCCNNKICSGCYNEAYKISNRCPLCRGYDDILSKSIIDITTLMKERKYSKAIPHVVKLQQILNDIDKEEHKTINDNSTKDKINTYFEILLNTFNQINDAPEHSASWFNTIDKKAEEKPSVSIVRFLDHYHKLYKESQSESKMSPKRKIKSVKRKMKSVKRKRKSIK